MTPRPCPRRSASLVAFAALAIGAACTSDIEGRAKDRLFPTARVLFDLDENFGGGGEPPANRFYQGFEFSGTGTAGRFRLDSGIGDTDYQVLSGSATYRFGVQRERGYFHGFVGLAVDRVELSDNPLISVDESFFGPVIGFEGRLRLRDWLHPYMREAVYFLEQGSFASQWEVGLMFTPCDRADLFAGFRRWDAEYGDAGPVGQDLDLEWRGVVVGMALRL